MENNKETNLQKIREATELLLLVPFSVIEDIPFFVSHPIFNITTVYLKHCGDKRYYNLLDADDYHIIVNDYRERIMNASVLGCYMMMRTPYKLTWLKYCEEYLSEKDLAKYLAYSWVEEENPNQDANCPISYLVKLFKKCNKQYLMTEEDYKIYQNLSDEITVYRGVAVNRNPNGLSWTQNLKTAQWFANRFNTETNKGYVQTAIVSKSKVLAYFNTRNEDEIVCRVPKKDIHILKGE